MAKRAAPGAGILVVAATVVIVTACTRRDDDRRITAAPERAAAAQTATLGAPSYVTAASDASVANPLHMNLKHDGPAPVGTVVTNDPCAVAQPTGALAMPLRHGGPNTPGQPNPLCMRLK